MSRHKGASKKPRIENVNERLALRVIQARAQRDESAGVSLTPDEKKKRARDEVMQVERQLAPKRLQLGDDDSDDEQEGQSELELLKKQNADDGTNQEAFTDDYGGRIKRIVAKNFMCHKHMSVVLGPHINYITGQNGSGKSAIVAALQICLGSNARKTNRGGRLSGLIREGSKDDAVVSVTLDNRSKKPFMGDLYGDSVTIERTLRRSGTSTYKLKSDNGDTISSRKGDVDALMKHYSILVDNPCCVLDQESSKLFLKGSEKGKYDFFLKASLMKDTIDLFAAEHDNRKNVAHEFSKRKEHLGELENDVDAAKRKVEELQTIGKLQDQLEQQRIEFMWAGYNEALQESLVASNAVSKAHRKCESLNEKLDRLRQERQEADSASGATEDQIQQLAKQVEQVEHEAAEARGGLRSIMQPLTNAKSAVEGSERQLESYKNQIRSIERDIENVREAELRRNPEAEKLRVQEAIAETQLEMRNLEDRESGFNDENAQEELYNRKLGAQEQVEAAKRQLRDDEGRLTQMQHHLERLRLQQTDKTAAFGAHVPKLLRAIDKETNRFHRPPVLIGMHVELSDMTYWRPAESVMRNLLKTFLVHDGHDLKKLRQLAAQLRVPAREVPVVMSKFLDKRHVINKPAPDFLTLESILEIDNDNVFNAVVDQASVESVVLFKTSAEATRRMFLDAGNHTVRAPTNVRTGLCLEATQYVVQRGSEVVIREDRNVSAPQYFSANVSEAIERAETDKGQLQETVRLHKREITDLTAQVKSIERAMRDAQQQHSKNRDQLRKLSAKLDKLKTKEQEMSSDETQSQVTAYQAYIEKVELEVVREKEKLQMKEQEVKQLEQSLPDKEAAIHAINSRKEALEAQVAALDGQLVKEGSKLAQLNTQLSNYEAKKKERDEKLQDMEAELQEKKEKADTLREAALEFGEEVTPNHASSQIRKSIDKTEASIERERERLSTISNEEPELLLQNAEIALERAIKKRSNTQELLRLVQNRLHDMVLSFDERERHWKKFQAKMRRLVSSYFDFFLSKRGFSGSLKFDDKKEELSMKWSKSNDMAMTQESSATDSKALSGGERSFTTIALLLAIGQYVKSPFRVMDEFDVFMDEVIRKTAIDQLCEAARARNASQYIFITPHDIGDVEVKPDVTRLKLRPKAADFGRSQTVLDDMMPDA